MEEIKNGVDLRVMTRAQGKPYRIYGATIDAQGNISEPVNIVKEFTEKGETLTRRKPRLPSPR